MKKAILTTLATVVLVILPFLISFALSKYSPYVEGNSFQRYVIISVIISIVFILIVLLFLKYFYESLEKISVGGAILFLLICPLVGIFGLASAPDASIKMIEHPEREHFRYILEFIAAILFGCFIMYSYISNLLKMSKITRWIMAVIFAVAFAEFIWEFSHHYLLPEGLKEWLNQGKRAEDFDKNYDNFNVLAMGVVGRYFQFTSIIWLSIRFYKRQHVKIWCPIVNIIFSLLGFVSATIVYINQFPFPKGFEILMLFFIPGIPFFLLYWLGVALLTKFKKSEIVD